MCCVSFQSFFSSFCSDFEVVNHSFNDLLRRLVGEKPEKWDFILSHVEFVYNNYVNRSTNKRHFEIVHGVFSAKPLIFFFCLLIITCVFMSKLLLIISIICMLKLDKKLF